MDLGQRVRCVSNHISEAPQAMINRRGKVLSPKDDEGFFEIQFDTTYCKNMVDRWHIHEEEIIIYQKRKYEDGNF